MCPHKKNEYRDNRDEFFCSQSPVNHEKFDSVRSIVNGILGFQGRMAVEPSISATLKPPSWLQGTATRRHPPLSSFSQNCCDLPLFMAPKKIAPIFAAKQGPKKRKAAESDEPPAAKAAKGESSAEAPTTVSAVASGARGGRLFASCLDALGQR